MNTKDILKLNPNQGIILKDEASILTAKEAGFGLVSPDYTITGVTTVRLLDNLATWDVCDISAAYFDGKAVLVVKVVDDNVAVRIMEPCECPDGTSFPAGDRQDQVEWKNFFLFQEPDDPENFDPMKLLYTRSMSIDGVDYGSDLGEMQGETSFSPPKSGMHNMLATLVEYSAVSECKYPDILLLEIGSPESRRGGLITLRKGRTVDPSEVEIL